MVQYEGYGGVFTKGKRAGRISENAMNQLIEEFRKARFFELSNYQSAATDLPVCVTQFKIGETIKEVVDYGLSPSRPDAINGLSSGAPKELLELEDRIDEIANSKKWVKGSLPRRLLHWH